MIVRVFLLLVFVLSCSFSRFCVPDVLGGMEIWNLVGSPICFSFLSQTPRTLIPFWISSFANGVTIWSEKLLYWRIIEMVQNMEYKKIVLGILNLITLNFI